MRLPNCGRPRIGDTSGDRIDATPETDRRHQHERWAASARTGDEDLTGEQMAFNTTGGINGSDRDPV